MLLEAQRVGRISKNLDISKAYEIIFPEFDHEDNQELGTAVNYLMQGLAEAKVAGWISDETAMKILFRFCDLEININDELARIAADEREHAG